MGKISNFIRPSCIQGVDEYRESDHSKRWKLLEINDEEGTFTIVLTKGKQDKSFGLTISGGTDKKEAPYISSIKENGLAEKSGYFTTEDKIVEISDTDILYYKHEEIIQLVRNAGCSLKLKLQYRLSKRVEDSMKWKKSFILVHRGKKGVEFSLKGGLSKDGQLKRPYQISSVREHSYLESVLFPKDYLLSINHQIISELHLISVNLLVEKSEEDILLEIKYNNQIGSIIENDKDGTCLVEFDLPNDRIRTGITLNVTFEYEDKGSIITISDIEEATLADRCGYLSVNDLLLSINGKSMEGISLQEASKLLKSASGRLKLHVLKTALSKAYEESDMMSVSDKFVSPSRIISPYSIQESSSSNNISTTSLEKNDIRNDFYNSTLNTKKNNGNRYNEYPCKNSFSPYNNRKTMTLPLPGTKGTKSRTKSIGSENTLRRSQRSRSSHRKNKQLVQYGSIRSFASSVLSSCSVQLSSQSEILEFISDTKEIGIQVVDGLMLNGSKDLVIIELEEDGAFARAACVQAGDRILSVNDVTTEYMTSEEFYDMLREIESPLRFKIAFDVADSVTPNEGTFTVKIKPYLNSIGITVKQPGPSDKERYLRISDILKGGPAYRLGMLSCGDQILSINNQCASQMEPYAFYEIIRKAECQVQLKFKKDEEMLGATFTIELTSNGEPLGITITGSDQPFEPIVISEILENGLAYQCNAIQVGDNLLAINEISLRGKTLSEACELLRVADNNVRLLIKRKRKKIEKKDSNESEPQVWTWSGNDQVHVVNHEGSISMVFEKESTGSLLSTTSSEEEISKYYSKQKHRRKTVVKKNSHPNSRASSRASSRGSSRNSNPTSLLDQEIRNTINLSRRGSPFGLRRFNSNPENGLESSSPMPRRKVNAGVARFLQNGYYDEPITGYKRSYTSPRIAKKYVNSGTKSLPNSPKFKNKMQANFFNSSPQSPEVWKKLIKQNLQDYPESENIDSSGDSCKNRDMQEETAKKRHIGELTLENLQINDRNINSSSRFKVNKVNESNNNNSVSSKDDSFDENTDLIKKSNLIEIAKLHISKSKSFDDAIEYKTFYPARMEKYRTVTQTNRPLISYQNRAKYSGNGREEPTISRLQGQTSFEDGSLSRRNGNLVIETVVLKRESLLVGFGFSVSDAVKDKGVYVRSIEKGSPAHLNGKIRKYDRLLQVNGTYCGDMCCNEIVPLLQSVEATLELIIERFEK